MKCRACNTKMQFEGIKEIETGFVNLYVCPVCGHSKKGTAKVLLWITAVLIAVNFLIFWGVLK